MLSRIERLLVDLSICAVLGLGFVITLNVVLRALFNSGLPDSTVIVAELMVAAVVLPLAATTAQRAHIAVEFVANRLPRRVSDGLIVFGSVFGLFALSPLIWAGAREAIGAIEKGSFFFGELMLPKWPGRVIFLVGMAVCWLRLLSMVVTDIATLRRGEPLSQPTGGH
ncbi:TRAP transporter small permease [Tropicibacter naphthalenivorans]|uniref:TRAP transporter small permease protein n=1 Tax=Tropicibacter naphthalenivorans TaxID=441103 RepID=A0A0P1GJE9_9RHOB|nr:TRAP transporter small permease [Tropicibacter naphthalenivorans]CUH81660.1 TRAP-type C4-dicarboxylate transport system, small permease component [Tropicibacter naphthalenivorans]SMC99414.1 TRAP-type mannitol/chloroaromatic compound transport system, small permease component [Tropicibacter naphthalenivorans]